MTDGKNLEFPPSFYARFPVSALSHHEMDHALANGYYRNGADMCTASARYMGQRWVSSVMLRLSIEGFEFKKRHRKLLRTNNLRFTFTFQAFSPTAEKEALWQRYKSAVHSWKVIPPLEQHLLRGKPANSFRTWEVCVFDEKKIVAFSAFDWGSTSLASLEAAYDPDFSSFSLGFYTMLLEILFCQNEQLRYYYPGFFPKDDPMFKYKLRPGEVDFFRLKTGAWTPFAEINAADWLLYTLQDKHKALKNLLIDAGFKTIDGSGHCLHVPSKKPSITASNLHLILQLKAHSGHSLLFVTWDVAADAYRVFEGVDINPAIPDVPLNHHYYYQVVQKNYFGQFSRAEDVVLLAQHFGEYCQTGQPIIGGA